MKRTIDSLTKEERERALFHFNAAVKARQKQWDHERVLEHIFARDLCIPIPDLAGCLDDDAVLSLDSLRDALETA